jgi:hypothetical protein
MFIKLAGDGVGEKCTGMEPFLIGAMVAGAAGKMYMEGEALNEQENALELKRKQAEAKASQDQIQRDEQLMHVQSAQLAEAAAQGMSSASGTLGALETESYNKFAQSSKTGKFNLESQSLAIDFQIEQLEDKYWADAFGTVADTASKAYGLKGSSGATTGTPQNTTGVFAKENYAGMPEHDYWGTLNKDTQDSDWLGALMGQEGKFSKHLRKYGDE